MPKKRTDSSYTIMLVPDQSAHVKRFVISRRTLRTAAWTVGLAFLFMAVGSIYAGVNFTTLYERALHNEELKDENLRLKTQLVEVERNIERIERTIERMERFDAKLRAVTRINDPERGLAIGPLTPAAGSGPEGGPGVDIKDDSRDLLELRMGLQERKIASLGKKALETETGLRELKSYIDAQKDLLASTPSIFPARGWITSEFGFRVDPYTSIGTFHKGLDVANEIGTPVTAPADGVVIYSGPHQGYGKFIVIDHGYGVVTRYGHLSRIAVDLGQKVRRGENLGAIGNTGRSTGPHLHYEVEVNGVPVNPRRYILED